MADLLDNCRFTAGSSGTDDFVDGTADPSCRNLEDAGAIDGHPYPYKAQSADGTEWEIGRGLALNTSGGWILERTDIQDSSNGGSAVNFTNPPKVLITAGKLEIQQVITPLMFGAAGDGSTDDTAAINAAITALPDGATLSGLGKTYKIAGSGALVTLKANMVLEDATFDMSAADNAAEGLVASGTLGSNVAILEDADAGELVLTTADGSGFAPKDWVYVGSSDMWDNWDDNVSMGEVHQIKAKSGDDITLYDPILYTMTTSPVMAKINTLDNLTLRNVHVIGSYAGPSGDQEGMRFSYCRGLVLEDCTVRGCDDRSVRFTLCIDFHVRGGEYGYANKTGLSYGLALGNCCTSWSIIGASFKDCRHGVTLGNTAGPNRHGVIQGCIAKLCREAGIDAHTAADDVIIEGNVIECDPNNSVCDGILYRSVNVTIANNRILNPGRHGINCQINATGYGDGSIDIHGNYIYKPRGSHGILVVKEAAGDLKSVGVSANTVIGNNVASSIGIRVATDSNTDNDFTDVEVSNNQVIDFTSTGIMVNADSSGSTVVGVVVANNLIRGTLAQAIYILADTDGNISRIAVTGNVVSGSLTRGLRCLNEEDIVVVGNVFRGSGTPVTITATNSVNANNLDGLAGSDYGKSVVSILVFDDSQNVATGDGAGDVFWRVPAVLNGYNLVAVAAQVQTAGTTGTTDIQIARTRSGSTVDMLSTKITIDSTEVDTITAATPAVINTSNDDVATGDRIRIDVDAVSTTPPKGLIVELTFQLP